MSLTDPKVGFEVEDIYLPSLNCVNLDTTPLSGGVRVPIKGQLSVQRLLDVLDSKCQGHPEPPELVIIEGFSALFVGGQYSSRESDTREVMSLLKQRSQAHKQTFLVVANTAQGYKKGGKKPRSRLDGGYPVGS
jgi:hypothetical protein